MIIPFCKAATTRPILMMAITALATQYALNPFVPEPKEIPQLARSPQSLSSGSIPLNNSAVPHRDRFDLIVQRDGDGGDTAQRTGMYYFLHNDPEGFSHALDHLEIYPGIYVRHPYQRDFRSDPRRFSRDQQRPLIIALGKYGMRERLWRMAKMHFLRLGKYQNLDYINPVGLGEYMRAFDNKALYPLLISTDFFLLASSIELILIASLNPDEADDNNHVMTLLQAKEVMPTPLSWLARKIYLELRPKNLGNYLLAKPDPVEGALAWYHRAETGGNPELGQALYAALRAE